MSSLELETSRSDVISRFVSQLAIVGAQPHGPLSASSAREVLTTLVEQADPGPIALWAADDLGIAGVSEALAPLGRQIVEVNSEGVGSRGEHLAQMDRAVVGITGALAGLADTGTVVLASGSGAARVSWLLPPVHIAVLNCRSVYPSMAAFFEAHASTVAQSSHVAFVTGPSRTADIELTLTRGVHGPVEVHVVLIEEAMR